MALPQPDVEGILNRRGYLVVVGWGRLWLGVKAEQTLSPLRLQPSSQLLHSCVPLFLLSVFYHYYFSSCVVNIQLWAWVKTETIDNSHLYETNIGASNDRTRALWRTMSSNAIVLTLGRTFSFDWSSDWLHNNKVYACSWCLGTSENLFPFFTNIVSGTMSG